jgi:hypothetical protein
LVGYPLGGGEAARLVAYLACTAAGRRCCPNCAAPDMCHRRRRCPSVIGISDCLLTRAHGDGTIVVDVEKHRSIESLAERDAATLIAWLEGNLS